MNTGKFKRKGSPNQPLFRLIGLPFLLLNLLQHRLNLIRYFKWAAR